jgi:hypothetical protein
MPSLNFDKLTRLLEAARAARLAARDIGERIDEARVAEARTRAVMERFFAERGRALPEEVEELLGLPPGEAAAIGRAHLEAWSLSPESFRELMYYRAARLRLEAMLETAQDHSEKLNAPLSILPEWLASHGFPNFVRDYQ